MQKAPRLHRAVVLLHVVDKEDLVWITPIVQRAKVEAYVTAEGFELVELLSDGFESAEDPAFFNKGFKCSRTARPKSLCLSSSRPADGSCRGIRKRVDQAMTSRLICPLGRSRPHE